MGITEFAISQCAGQFFSLEVNLDPIKIKYFHEQGREGDNQMIYRDNPKQLPAPFGN